MIRHLKLWWWRRRGQWEKVYDEIANHPHDGSELNKVATILSNSHD